MRADVDVLCRNMFPSLCRCWCYVRKRRKTIAGPYLCWRRSAWERRRPLPRLCLRTPGCGNSSVGGRRWYYACRRTKWLQARTLSAGDSGVGISASTYVRVRNHWRQCGTPGLGADTISQTVAELCAWCRKKSSADTVAAACCNCIVQVLSGASTRL